MAENNVKSLEVLFGKLNLRDVSAVKEAFNKLRNKPVRSSEEIVLLWETGIAKQVSKFGDDIWSMYEQLCISSLDCGREDLATQAIAALNARFPDCPRVKRLIYLKLEFFGQYDEVKSYYSKMVKINPVDTVARKRQFAILRAQGKYPEAIKEMVQYTTSFQSDAEVWSELAELYLLVEPPDYAKAAFCVEELLLHAPGSPTQLVRYAEIRYSMGGPENVELAAKYFAAALRARPAFVRALYGLSLCASFFTESQKGGDKLIRNDSNANPSANDKKTLRQAAAASLASTAGLLLSEAYRSAPDDIQKLSREYLFGPAAQNSSAHLEDSLQTSS